MRNRIRDIFDPGSKMEKLGSEFRDTVFDKKFISCSLGLIVG
jgi:hypothetical protein